MRILILNAGSSSLKFQLLRQEGESFARLCSGIVKEIGGQSSFTFQVTGGDGHAGVQAVHTHTEAVDMVLAWMSGLSPGTPVSQLVDAVGHRVVQGGCVFHKPVRVENGVVDQIEILGELAPLHNFAAASCIRAASLFLGRNVPMVAVFDTSFHCTLHEQAATYALPRELTERFKIRRYGAHGTAHRYMTLRFAELTGIPLERTRLITLQLGNGSSATAVQGGKSADTSMGFTPLEGLVMGTRSGDIDPAVVLYLVRRAGMTFQDLNSLLNERSGLLGVSGETSDMGRLLERMAEPDGDGARRAVDIYCYRVKKYIGAYFAILGGADAVVFGGGIGENAPTVRAEICRGLECLGLRLAPSDNALTVRREGRISAPDSAVQAWVIPVDEEVMIARDTLACLAEAGAEAV